MHPLWESYRPLLVNCGQLIASAISVVTAVIVPSGHRGIILPGRRNHARAVADSLFPFLCLTNIPQCFPCIFFCFPHCLPGGCAFSAVVPTAAVIAAPTVAAAVIHPSTAAAAVIHPSAAAAAVIAAPTAAAKAAAAKQ